MKMLKSLKIWILKIKKIGSWALSLIRAIVSRAKVALNMKTLLLVIACALVLAAAAAGGWIILRDNKRLISDNNALMIENNTLKTSLGKIKSYNDELIVRAAKLSTELAEQAAVQKENIVVKYIETVKLIEEDTPAGLGEAINVFNKTQEELRGSVSDVASNGLCVAAEGCAD